MKRRVRITKVPNKANGGQNGSADGLKRFMYGKNTKADGINTFSEKPFTVNKNISAVPREQSNLEAEGGEFAVVPGQGGIPESYNIQGPRHGAGGVPLDLDEGAFIYSDNKKGMKIKDKDILEEFGIKTSKKKKKHKGLTPAAIAKKYQINDYKKTLLDPNSSRIEKETAELMIKNYNEKLAKLALVQESMKGFPDGIPEVATPFMEMNGVDPAMFEGGEDTQQGNPSMAAYGTGVVNDGIATYTMGNGGSAKKRVRVSRGYQRGGEYKGAFWDSILRDGGDIPKAQNGKSQRGTQYMYDGDKMVNRREMLVTLDPEKQGENGSPIYSQVMGNAFLEDKEYGPADARFIYGADERSGGLDYSQGNYNFKTILEGQDDPHLEIFNQMKTANPAGYAKNIKKFNKKHKITVLADGGGVGEGEKELIGKEIPEKYRTPQYDVNDPNFTWNNIMPGDILKRKDGSWGVYNGGGRTMSYAGDDFEQTFGNNEEFGSAYAELDATFKDPKVKEVFAKKVKAAMKKNNTYARKGDRPNAKKFTNAEIDAFTPDQLVDNFLNMQKRNYSLKANSVNAGLFADKDGKLGTQEQMLKRFHKNKKLAVGANDPLKLMTDAQAIAEYKKYKENGINSLDDAFNKFGVSLGDNNVRLQQATYWGYNDLLQDRDNNLLDSEISGKLKSYDAPAMGYSDEGQTGSLQISPIDGVYTNTTAAELAYGKANRTFDDVVKEAVPKKDPEFKHPDYAKPDEESRPWLQDELNMANLLSQRYKAKKYLPNSYPVNLETPNPTFYDPSRAIAANEEQAAMAMQNLRTFTGPQASNRFSGIMGEGVRNSANIISDYQDKNVGLANQFAMSNAGIRNQEEIANKQAALNLYNGNVITNQQYDNTTRQMDRNLTDGTNQLITNMQETQAWNSLNPYYKTKPTIGGGLWKTDAQRPVINEGRVPSNGHEARLQEIENLQYKFPNADPKIIADMVNGSGSQAAYPSATNRRDQEAELARQAYRSNPQFGRR